MICPKPNCPRTDDRDRGETKVLETRASEGRVMRRRKCRTCGHTFSTAEVIVAEPRAKVIAYAKTPTHGKNKAVTS